MFKKFLAGLTTIVLSLGMVALTAGPASAHHNTISVSVSCNTGTEGYWKVTWSVTNSEADKTETITSSTDPALVPVGTVIGAGATSTFIEFYATKPAANKKLTLGAQWSNGVTNSNDETLKKNQFSDDCVPDDTDRKIWICHANNGDGTGGFVANEVDIDSIIKDNGHAEHQDGRDIIPPFDYVKQGEAGSFPGLNWNPPYTQAFLDAGCAEPTVTPAVPTFTEAVCTAPGQLGQASYVIPSTTGVTYTVQLGGAGGFLPAAAATYYVPAGTTVEVKAVADTGYQLTGTTEWSRTFSVIDCIEDAPVEPVVAADQECVIDDLETGAAHYESGTITIPGTAHVTYSVNGVVKAAGVHDYAPGVYTISAEADPGYALTGVPDPWTVEVTAAEPCGQLIDLPVVDPVVTFAQTTCSTSGSYTLAVEPGEESAGVIWSVSGGLPNTVGTHAVISAGTVTITATAAPGYGFAGDDDGVVEWSFDFTTLPDDCLPTLALTGGSIAAGGLGLSALLTLGGILLFTARKRDLVA